MEPIPSLDVFLGRVKVISTVGNQSTLCQSSPYPSPCTEYASLLEVYPTVDCLQLCLYDNRRKKSDS